MPPFWEMIVPKNGGDWHTGLCLFTEPMLLSHLCLGCLKSWRNNSTEAAASCWVVFKYATNCCGASRKTVLAWRSHKLILEPSWNRRMKFTTTRSCCYTTLVLMHYKHILLLFLNKLTPYLAVTGDILEKKTAREFLVKPENSGLGELAFCCREETNTKHKNGVMSVVNVYWVPFGSSLSSCYKLWFWAVKKKKHKAKQIKTTYDHIRLWPYI